jgi:hypothetical protein
MTSRWPDPDRARIGSYLASLDLRNLKSRTCYRQVLHSFQDIVERHGVLDQRFWCRFQFSDRRPERRFSRGDSCLRGLPRPAPNHGPRMLIQPL